MRTIQIRDVPDAAHRTLKIRAAAAGQSLNTYLLALLDEITRQPTVAEVLERNAGRPGAATASSAEIIRAERDAADNWATKHGAA